MKKWFRIDNKEDLNCSKKYRVISLFSGCGGKDLGLLGGFSIFGSYYGKNNFEIVYANDIEKNACKTYEYNFDHKIVNKDIYEIDEKELPKADIVIGGFPCQDFSLAGSRKGFENEKRGNLYLEMKRVIDHVKPLAFVAENVQGITNLNGTSTIDKIISDFEDSGYTVEYHLFNTADYEVPQTRRRIIIIGLRKDVFPNSKIPFPAPILGDETGEPWMTAKDAIDDLWNELDKGKFDNHETVNYSKAKFYPGKKTQGNYRIKADAPSPTIRAEHHGNIEGHYRCIGDIETDDVTKWRRLTIRECARLQSFPDDFYFPTSTSSAYKEIGNAVPPVFAWYIFRAISVFLEKNK